MSDPRAPDAFRAAIQERLGVAPGGIVGDGKIHRFATKPNGRDDAGWYVLYGGDFPSGAFGDWRLDVRFRWRAQEISSLSKDDRRRIAEQKEQRRKALEAEVKKATASALARWRKAKPCGEHPYLQRKNVQPYGVREASGCVLVPVYLDDKLVSLQVINADGVKLFDKGTRVKGGSFVIGETAQAQTIVIGEGFATCATIHEATELPVVVAFNDGNLLPVAKRVREKHPSATIIIAADDDFEVEREQGINPGIEFARQAAEAVGGAFIVPPFNRNGGDVGTDWNDLIAIRATGGRAALKWAVSGAQPRPSPPVEEAAPSDDAVSAEIIELARLRPLDYERKRKEVAKKLGVRAAALDQQIIARPEF